MSAIALDASRAAAVFLDERLPDRFWSKCTPCPITGCWLWFAATTKDGYGAISVDDDTLYAHRFAYEHLVGPLPPTKRGRRMPGDLEIDHRCRHRWCVNPSHLQLVTHQTNVLRGASPPARWGPRVTCPKGHPFDERNTYRHPTNGRVCRACHAAAAAARRRTRR